MLWELLEGPLTDQGKRPLATMMGHAKKVTLVACNPSVAYVCASASADNTLKVWSLEASSPLSSYTSPSDLCLSLHWDQQGSLLASTWRSKQVKITDPRTAAASMVFQGHEGAKPSKVTWGKDLETVITTGFSKLADRQVALWDLRSTARPVTLEVIDQANSSLIPFYDPDTSLLFLAGKGDGNFRYYELDSSPPFLHYVNNYKSTTPCKGFTFIPKRRVNVGTGEVMRAYKLTGTTVEAITVRVPRKAEGFQEDIYPDCVGVTPGLRVKEWLSGRNQAPPRVSMRDLGSIGGKGVVFQMVAGLIQKQLTASKPPPTVEPPPADLPVHHQETVVASVPVGGGKEETKEAVTDTEVRLAAAEALVARLTAENATLRQTLSDYNLILFGSPDLPS